MSMVCTLTRALYMVYGKYPYFSLLSIMFEKRAIMDKKDKVQYLIVDTSAFLRNAALQDIGVNILTEKAVVDEITNKRQLRRLVVLPYDLKVQEAFTENIKYVTEFSKKTGDYTSLSATDIKVIALTYQLEKEKVGTDHLKNIPTTRIITSTVDKENEDNLKPPVGFYIPKEKERTELNMDNKTDASLHNTEETNVKENIQITENLAVNNTINNAENQNQSTSCVSDVCNEFLDESDYETASESEEWEIKDLSEKFAKLACDPTDLKIEGENEDLVDDILAPIGEINFKDQQNNVKLIKDEDYDSDDNDNDSDDDDDDDSWITPSNLTNIKKQMDSAVLEEKAATVACLTMDFAMQNVLMQIGLNVATLDGRMIKQMRTFIFRCYACFRTTSIMTKIFCPHCGNKTLKKVEVTLGENGEQQIHINFRRPLSAKGKKFSLPMPKGGKHSNNPILCEDQPMPDQRPTRLARTKNNPLEDDYIAGFSPFIVRDVNSKSAMLGIRPCGAVKYWMKRNPNESRKKRK
ncbi:RNA-binding protein NOB1 [Odontomachus brunneus]|uniref:RNA-binding protein NOB1 n=1 Tax=Odontomachus brunneus TaxID=486640 RepID=UPI0013F21776|nr:RNA-binding protein NOB1 [Odontomachus brunneus]